MDNSKRNIHNSGPLGKLMQTGQIKKVDLEEESSPGKLQHVGLEGLNTTSSYFKTQAGIKFNENELVFIDPKECEPWEYANRSEEEMGEIDELMESIKSNTQLQPALIRIHPAPHGDIKYQVIFGRRRLEACKRLGMPFLVIKKNGLTTQEAIACQDAENKLRANVSNYSNALLYRRLIQDKTFSGEKELAEKLHIPKQSLNDLMSFNKIPQAVVSKIPDMHNLPVYMALKIAKLASEGTDTVSKLTEIAPKIGNIVNTPSKLEAALNQKSHIKSNVPHGTLTINAPDGKKLFTFKIDSKGIPTITLNKAATDGIDFNRLCDEVKLLLLKFTESGAPDSVA